MTSENPRLEVSIGKLKLKNPVMVASGTFGNGEEYKDLVDLKNLGAIVSKTITLKARDGNPPPRIAETASGMLNSIGLENKGLKDFLDNKLPFMRRIGIPVIVSIAGQDADEFFKLAKALDKEGVSGIELNLSCPNLNKKIFAHDPRLLVSVIKKARKATSKTLIAKLSPNVCDIAYFARVSKENGADAVALINTVIGMAVDIKNKRPMLGNVKGGLSGPAIKPIALRMVWEVYLAVNIPIIGMGGIMDYKDALEFVICGASAISVGTANFVNPSAVSEIPYGIKEYMRQYKIENIKKLRGSLRISA